MSPPPPRTIPRRAPHLASEAAKATSTARLRLRRDARTNALDDDALRPDPVPGQPLERVVRPGQHAEHRRLVGVQHRGPEPAEQLLPYLPLRDRLAQRVQ